jgi:hypothetical protein
MPKKEKIYPRKGVEGIDWDLINQDRKQVGNKPFPEKTKFKGDE